MIIAEPSGEVEDFDRLGLACRGGFLGKILIKGTQMHSSLSERSDCINPSIKMAEVLLGFAQNLKNEMSFGKHSLYPDGPIINPGVLLEGGVFYGVIPGSASFGFDIRYIPGMSDKTIKKDIEKFLKKLMDKDNNLNAKLIVELWAPPVEIDRGHPLVKACMKATRTVIGKEPKPMGLDFATDGVFFEKAQQDIDIIPAFGPGFIRSAHGPDEYINTSSIIDAAKIFAIAALDYLGPG
jgi:acetylornithine deacetylase/succinyl-diaminopimelate desuccinylase-like protein